MAKARERAALRAAAAKRKLARGRERGWDGGHAVAADRDRAHEEAIERRREAAARARGHRFFDEHPPVSAAELRSPAV